MKKGIFFVWAVFFLCLVVAGAVFGSDYPNKPINVLIGYAAGGSTDLIII
jgi:tripartite-type tricarboxylate transporter receptor subunit TctC